MHSKKEFETDDEVQYTTGDFESSSFSPHAFVQYQAIDFWRLSFTYRLTEYSSLATTDLSGAATKEVNLNYSMLSVVIQKMWTPLAKPIFLLWRRN